MSLFSLTIGGVAAASAISYGVGQFASPTIETEILIDASPQAVWAVLSDSASYAEWNPFVTQISGDLVAGHRLSITLQLAGRRPMRLSPKVLVATSGQELRWVGRFGVRGIFDGEHYFLLDRTADGATRLRHGETFRGILAHGLLALIRAETQSGFMAMNAALKVRAEAAE